MFGSTFKNLAFFGQGVFNLTDRFRAIGGVRYTADQTRRLPQSGHHARGARHQPELRSVRGQDHQHQLVGQGRAAVRRGPGIDRLRDLFARV
ncbi:hypothetical protein QP162_07990 [Sphingomonas aurantiaca]